MCGLITSTVLFGRWAHVFAKQATLLLGLIFQLFLLMIFFLLILIEIDKHPKNFMVKYLDRLSYSELNLLISLKAHSFQKGNM